jgi:hypothetical protein
MADEINNHTNLRGYIECLDLSLCKTIEAWVAGHDFTAADGMEISVPKLVHGVLLSVVGRSISCAADQNGTLEAAIKFLREDVARNQMREYRAGALLN